MGSVKLAFPSSSLMVTSTATGVITDDDSKFNGIAYAVSNDASYEYVCVSQIKSGFRIYRMTVANIKTPGVAHDTNGIKCYAHRGNACND